MNAVAASLVLKGRGAEKWSYSCSSLFFLKEIKSKQTPENPHCVYVLCFVFIFRKLTRDE